MSFNPGNGGKNREMRQYVHGHVKPEIKAGILLASDPAKAEAIGTRSKRKKSVGWSKARA
jgi:predicted NAD-dependent protein-ADP-ribosyltransferase YbiA (DUF1768 family)